MVHILLAFISPILSLLSTSQFTIIHSLLIMTFYIPPITSPPPHYIPSPLHPLPLNIISPPAPSNTIAKPHPITDSQAVVRRSDTYFKGGYICIFQRWVHLYIFSKNKHFGEFITVVLKRSRYTGKVAHSYANIAAIVNCWLMIHVLGLNCNSVSLIQKNCQNQWLWFYESNPPLSPEIVGINQEGQLRLYNGLVPKWWVRLQEDDTAITEVQPPLNNPRTNN